MLSEIKMQPLRQVLLVQFFYSIIIIVLGEDCPSPPYKSDAVKILQFFGFNDSCTASAISYCDHGCTKDFFTALRDSEKELEKVLSSLRSMTSCLKGNQEDVTTTASTNQATDKNCYELQQTGDTVSGVRQISPFSCCPEQQIAVYCDQETDGGGWTVIQRSSKYEMQKNSGGTFMEFTNGFGNIEGEFWLGLENIHQMTNYSRTVLRVDLEDVWGEKRYAIFNDFRIGNMKNSYPLESIGEYSGDAGNSLLYHLGHRFSTWDHDVDSTNLNCAAEHHGGWWYNNCLESNLNGLFDKRINNEIVWKGWQDYEDSSIVKASMMIRPAHTP